MNNIRKKIKKYGRRLRIRTRRHVMEMKKYIFDRGSLDGDTISKIRKIEVRLQCLLLISIAIVSVVNTALILNNIDSYKDESSVINEDLNSKTLIKPIEPVLSIEDENFYNLLFNTQNNIAIEKATTQEENVSSESEEETIEYKFPLTKKEWKIFFRIVEAEVTGESYPGCTKEELKLAKRHVADVIINRMLDDRFDNDMESLIFAENQFMPTWDGRYWEVEVTSMTKEVVREAMLTTSEDTTNGAVFFCRGNMPDREFLFKDAVGHNFFK